MTQSYPRLWRRWCVVVFGGAAFALAAFAQQADGEWRPLVDHPAFEAGLGPRVLIDAGHHNYQTEAGGFAPFANLLRADGYVVGALEATISGDSLEGCEVLVIAAPVAAANADEWSRPHLPAFTSDELISLLVWIKEGGALLLVLEHAPIPGATADLCAMLGVHALDGEARNSARDPLPDLFLASEGGLSDHPILLGRGESERVPVVGTWNGCAFLASREFEPLMVYGPGALAYVDLTNTIPGAPAQAWPVFECEGWLAGAARKLGEGRVVVLGEAGMCTALRGGDGRARGVNAPGGEHNALFILNTMHWLSGVLGAEEDDGETKNQTNP